MHNKKDIAEKKLEDYPEVFADIFNVLMFKGQYIKEELLKSGPTESIYKYQQKSRLQERDVLKYYKGTGMNIASFGIENQSVVDQYMPIRVMGYDYGSYRHQMELQKKLYPVITLVLNFSGKRWSAEKALSRLFDIPVEIRPFFQDYGIYVVDMCDLDEETISRFQSDFKSIAAFFTYGINCLEHEELYDEITHIDEVIDLISTFNEHVDEKDIEQLIISKQNGGMITMCDIIKEIKDQGIKEGRSEGEIRKLIELMVKKVMKHKDLLQIADELEETENSLAPLYNAVVSAAPEYDIDQIFGKIAVENYSKVNK